MKIVIAGGRGALGRRLVAHLAGHEVVVLTRGNPGPGELHWDGMTVGPWAEQLRGAAVINLAGELVDKRPTARNVELLRSSRVQPTRALVEAAKHYPVATWIQASTLAIYSDAGEQRITEDTPVPERGLPQMTGVARAWEAALDGAVADRIALLRTGIVLDRGTPALDRLALITKVGLGGRIASGRQWISWIHIDDRLHIVDLALANQLDGIVVASAPNPVRNAELMAALRRALRRPAAPPTPTWLLRAGAVLMRTDPALALTGRHGTSTKVTEFHYPTIESALDELFTAHRRP